MGPSVRISLEGRRTSYVLSYYMRTDCERSSRQANLYCMNRPDWTETSESSPQDLSWLEDTENWSFQMSLDKQNLAQILRSHLRVKK